MTLEDSILAQRLRVMRRAHELGSVTAACREAGISRTLFYRWRKRFERYGPDGLHPRRRQARRGRPPQIPPHVERLVLGQALAWPTWGSRRLSAHLERDLSVSVAPSTVQRILRRVGLGRRRDRLALLEHPSAGTCGLLTERTRRALARARQAARRRHGPAERPGELVSLDTFSIGKLQGVGKVWQITACDAACSYGVAWLLPELSARATAAFLRQILLPVYRQAGWSLQRVLTDGGSEFRGAFAEACQALGIRHTRTQPRHAWTNGFVERLQGTILHEHWRIEFRRQFFTTRAAMQRSLDGFMRFSNEQRPHHGYRVRGRTPAELFRGVAALAIIS
ncbi:MAG: helix-turn-helix domain-containing protein [Armatimonadota bacterium]|nr:helix-turn-helix domain-containing protein [Armatimonadota bacterium]MDR7528910.1 helix-turn-helix domain-containing protein [Armatimonadota bacterium]